MKNTNLEQNVTENTIKEIHIHGLKKSDLSSFQDLLIDTIAWDSQLAAEYADSHENEVVIECSFRIQALVQLTDCQIKLDKQVDYELNYQQDINQLIGFEQTDSQYLIDLDEDEIDLWSLEESDEFTEDQQAEIQNATTQHESTYQIYVDEIENYLKKLMTEPFNTQFQSKIVEIVGEVE